jgi:hypothetical protein
MGARSYIPSLGRFLTPDPVPGGSANPYDYADQDPVNLFDLGGECPKKDAGKSSCGRGKKGTYSESKREHTRRGRREIRAGVRSVLRQGSFGVTFKHPLSKKKEEGFFSSLESAVASAGASAGHWSLGQVESVVSSVGGAITSAAPSCEAVGIGLDTVSVGAGVVAIVGSGGTAAVVIGGFAGIAGDGFDVAGKEGAC